MHTVFAEKFSSAPEHIADGVYYYASDREGDQFDEADADEWQNGRFERNWNKGMRENNWRELTKVAADAGLPFIELACGPGMGLTPEILSINPELRCMATDACSLLIKNWKAYSDKNLLGYNIDFAAFSVMNMPFKDDSVDAFTSSIGLSSTRNGEAGRSQALKEIYRTLKIGGYLYAVENEWTDRNAIAEVFALWGRENWFKNDAAVSWHDKFAKSGLEIVFEKPALYRKLESWDNELGKAAEKFNIEIGMRFTEFILQKV